MVWFRVDDNLAFHPKAMQAGNAAMGLWVRAGSWCAQQLNDGVVPTSIVAALGGNEFVADDLVAAGLWHEHPKGYEFHDWEGYQFTRDEVEASRAAARIRMQKRRSGEHQANGTVRANFARSSASPTLPKPSKDGSATAQSAAVVRDEIGDVFETAWSHWPRKQSKAKAREKFLALVTKGKGGGIESARSLAAQIIAHGDAYTAHRYGDFTPYLVTWLNQQRWDDPLPTPRSGGSSQADTNASILARYASEGDHS